LRVRARRDIAARERGGVVMMSIVEPPSISAGRTIRDTIEYQVGVDWGSGSDNDPMFDAAAVVVVVVVVVVVLRA